MSHAIKMVKPAIASGTSQISRSISSANRRAMRSPTTAIMSRSAIKCGRLKIADAHDDIAFMIDRRQRPIYGGRRRPARRDKRLGLSQKSSEVEGAAKVGVAFSCDAHKAIRVQRLAANTIRRGRQDIFGKIDFAAHQLIGDFVPGERNIDQLHQRRTLPHHPDETRERDDLALIGCGDAHGKGFGRRIELARTVYPGLQAGQCRGDMRRYRTGFFVKVHADRVRTNKESLNSKRSRPSALLIDGYAKPTCAAVLVTSPSIIIASNAVIGLRSTAATFFRSMG